MKKIKNATLFPFVWLAWQAVRFAVSVKERGIKSTLIVLFSKRHYKSMIFNGTYYKDTDRYPLRISYVFDRGTTHWINGKKERFGNPPRIWKHEEEVPFKGY